MALALMLCIAQLAMAGHSGAQCFTDKGPLMNTTNIGILMCEQLCFSTVGCESFTYNVGYLACVLYDKPSFLLDQKKRKRMLSGNTTLHDVKEPDMPCPTRGCGRADRCLRTKRRGPVCVPYTRVRGKQRRRPKASLKVIANRFLTKSWTVDKFYLLENVQPRIKVVMFTPNGISRHLQLEALKYGRAEVLSICSGLCTGNTHGCVYSIVRFRYSQNRAVRNIRYLLSFPEPRGRDTKKLRPSLRKHNEHERKMIISMAVDSDSSMYLLLASFGPMRVCLYEIRNDEVKDSTKCLRVFGGAVSVHVMRITTGLLLVTKRNLQHMMFNTGQPTRALKIIGIDNGKMVTCWSYNDRRVLAFSRISPCHIIKEYIVETGSLTLG